MALNDMLFLLSLPIFLAAVAMVVIWARLVRVDGWKGATLFTLPARSLNWITGGQFFAELNVTQLNSWRAPYKLGDVFPSRR